SVHGFKGAAGQHQIGSSASIDQLDRARFCLTKESTQVPSKGIPLRSLYIMQISDTPISFHHNGLITVSVHETDGTPEIAILHGGTDEKRFHLGLGNDEIIFLRS